MKVGTFLLLNATPSSSAVLTACQSTVPIRVLFIKPTKYLPCSVARWSDFDLAGKGIQNIAIMVFMRFPTSPTYAGTKMLQTAKKTGKWINIINKTFIPLSGKGLGTWMGNNPFEVAVQKAIKELTSFHGDFGYGHSLKFH